MKPDQIQALPRGFSRGGWEYRRIERIGPIAIYERYRAGSEAYGLRPRISYETIIIRIQNPATMPDGRILPLRESYPAPSQFGKFGWSFQTLDAARSKFRLLETCLRVVRRGCPQPLRSSEPLHYSETEPEELSEAKANLAKAISERL